MNGENTNQKTESISGLMRFWLAFRKRIIIGAVIGALLFILTIVSGLGGGNILVYAITFIITVVGGGIVGFVLPFIWKFIIKPIIFVVSFIIGLFSDNDRSSPPTSHTSTEDVIYNIEILNTSMNPIGFIRRDNIMNTSMNPIGHIRGNDILNTSMNSIGHIRGNDILNTSMNPIGHIRGNASITQKGAGGFLLLNML